MVRYRLRYKYPLSRFLSKQRVVLLVELAVSQDIGKLAVWCVVVLLFALFVFSIAFVQQGVRFSDEEVAKAKRDRISGEVFGNLVYHVVFIGLILVLGVVGYVAIYSRSREYTITSEPGELAS
jgi:NADH:ubiquinone oxidoreductase subunit 6 (subunit J)